MIDYTSTMICDTAWDEPPYRIVFEGRFDWPVYVPERTCMWSYDDCTDTWDAECGGKTVWDPDGHPPFCPHCGAEVVEE